MCLLLALRDDRVARLWVAANRDERLTRPWQLPGLLSLQPPVFGGRDVLGGGTWLAANLAAGFVVGVTNARLGAPPGRRSRGELVYDAAAQPSLAEAVALLAEVDMESYGAFNLLLADVQAIFVATNYPKPRIESVAGPLAALGNEALGSEGGRMQKARAALAEAAALGDQLVPALTELLADHHLPDPFCRHWGEFGTVCATICSVLGTTFERYLFAPGAPCRTPFAPLPLPLPPYS